MSAAGRLARTQEADALCGRAFVAALGGDGAGPGGAGPDGAGPDGGVTGGGTRGLGEDDTGLALVAVGGYGRAELAPFSDLDVVLVHDDLGGSAPRRGWSAEGHDALVRRVAERVWYPLWDSGVDLDHSVRALGQITETARADPRVALGLLDARHLAGDPALTLRLRAELLAQWRRDARTRLPALRELVERRGARQGELAHATVPDLKESVGGLRDATVLKALQATWLVDVSDVDLERGRLRLLDIRDALHEVSGRATDRIGPDVWPDLADALGLPDAETAQRRVREVGRRLTHLSRLTWRRVEAVLDRPPATRRRSPSLRHVASGVAVSGGEIVLEAGSDPRRDPLLLLRAAAEAAERGLMLAPASAARLARAAVDEPEPTGPWGSDARNLLTRLLAAGPGLLPVWETLDETGALERLLPEWSRVRLLPHASIVHRYTVDRHVVEACMEASRLIRRVARPDVLMVATLLHDIGKGELVDHSVVGEPIARAVAVRMGFDDDTADLVGRLVRRHLLLAEVATTRDPQDPATLALVLERVPDLETLDLLEVLTEADARATSPKAWSTWRAELVAGLAERVRLALAPGPGCPAPEAAEELPVPDAVRADPEHVDVRVAERADGLSLTVTSGDRVGLMADIAGALSLARVPVRAARAWTQGDVAVSVWDAETVPVEESVLRQQVESVARRAVDPASRLARPRTLSPEAAVLVRHDASREATVLEVRVEDRAGVVWLVCSALAALDLTVRSAHLTTLGPQAVDVFYVQELGAGALSDERAAAAVHAVRRALLDPATLDAHPR